VSIDWFGVLFLAAVLALLGVGLWQSARERRRRNAVTARLREREPLSAAEFAERFFGPDPKRVAVASALRDLLEFDSKIPLAGLRPDDQLEEIMGCRISADPPFFLDIEERLGVEMPLSQEHEFVERTRWITTFRDLVDFVVSSPPKETAG